MTEEAREPPGVEVTGGGEPDMGIRNQMQLVGKSSMYSKTLSHLPSSSYHCSPNKQANSGNSSNHRPAVVVHCVNPALRKQGTA